MYLSSFMFTAAVLPVLLLSYYLVPAKRKTVFLLVCSLLIYGWGSPARLLYLLACIFYNYGVGLLLERWRGRKVPGMILLGFSAAAVTAGMIWVRTAVTEGIQFPFGAAIYSLQGLGYLIGVYRGRHPAAEKFTPLALYLALFPMLYAGPLLPYVEFQEQLGKRSCTVCDLSEGLAQFIRGLAEKVVLADTYGYIFRELRQATEMSMLTAWLTTLSFSMYLYFELLGYSEMARGLCCAFGFSLPRNFSHPFFTSNLTAFMQNWNITLLLWFQTNFRHFLFEGPQKKWVRLASLVLMWVLIGAWYGMRTQFWLWGLAVGTLLVLEKTVLGDFLKKRYMFGLICTAIVPELLWVLFFAEDLAEAGIIWKAMLGFGSGIADQFGFYFFTSYIALLLLGFYIATDLFRNITERIAQTAFGKSLEAWKPLVHGVLLVFSMASMLYGERAMGLWLHI